MKLAHWPFHFLSPSASCAQRKKQMPPAVNDIFFFFKQIGIFKGTSSKNYSDGWKYVF